MWPMDSDECSWNHFYGIRFRFAPGSNCWGSFCWTNPKLPKTLRMHSKAAKSTTATLPKATMRASPEREWVCKGVDEPITI